MISLVEGRPGQGKTLYGCDLIFRHLSRKKTFVASNIEVVFDVEDKRQGRFKQLSVASTIEDIRELPMAQIYNDMGCDRIVLVVDEIQTIMNSRRWAELPPEFEYFLQQHRHYKFDIIGLTQSVKRADPVMRELIQRWFRIGKIFTVRLPFKQSWGFFYLVEYDPDSMESQTRKYDRIGWPWLFVATPFICRMYDTYQKFPNMSRKGRRETHEVVFEEKTTLSPRVLRRTPVDNLVASSDTIFKM